MRRGQAGRVTSTVVVAVSVLALGAALLAFVLDGSGSNGDEQRVVADEQAASESASPSESSLSPSVTPSPIAEATPTKAPATTAKPKPSPTTSPRPKPAPSPAPSLPVPNVYVEVYNMTSVTGLAASKAAQLQDAGWQVVGIDNWRGNIPSSTVYYPDGMADTAVRLARTLGIGRTRGAVAPMKFDRLTVILTSDAV
jgi:LytR cell envelope-related transcriptional attenuator